ncbi:MAG: GAF domain-containing protein [Melioribacteraceae bacterium]|nr:GAF domain-containing protein [Melioribacteraceae bacterium]MCF8355548.1 GAF domain-containing protein [Melioribacteraceae bacterium]MCF8394223.1 GAF domain-containing protein [Melioribacteraceae bacterium]MCF8419943.1 GAF domain-containing protein [Melioribacteraceae bacterium]
MDNQLLTAFKNNSLFKDIDLSNIDLSEVKGKLHSLNEGNIIYEKGDSPGSIYLVIDGQVNLLKRKPDGSSETISAGPNMFFGQNEFFGDSPRSQTAVAAKQTYLVELNQQELITLITQDDLISRNLRGGVTEEDSFSNEIEVQPDEFDTEENGVTETTDLDLNMEDNTSEPENTDDSKFSEIQGDEDAAFWKSMEGDKSVDFNEPKIENAAEKKINEPEKENMETNKHEDIDPDKLAKDINAEIEAQFNFPNSDDEFNLDDAVKTEEKGSDEDFDKDTQKEKLIEATRQPLRNKEGKLILTADHLEMINRAAQMVNTNIKLDELLKNIVDVASELTAADRGTLYLVDKEKNELWSKVLQGSELKEIHLKIGEGIAGWVAQNGEVVNLSNAEKDKRFKSDYDKSSGYRTKSMLVFPVKNKEKEVVGVLQLLNDEEGHFSRLDEEFLNALSIHAALALENSELLEKLLKTERVNTLGKMANFLISDIKKPVLVSKRYVEHLRSKEIPKDIIQVLDMTLEQLNHVADLVQTTSNYSEGTKILRAVKTSINEALQDFSNRVYSLVQTKNSQLLNEFAMDVYVKLDRKEFFQAYNHIIKNACDAMPEGGTIEVTTEVENDLVKIYIKDSGLGIPETIRDKIFEPFMSHGKKEGTGLGLAITKKIVQDHGGSIDLRSELGEGTTFIIALPTVPA